MIKKVSKTILLIIAIMGVFVGCSKDDNGGIEFVDYSIKVNLPEEMKDVDLSGLNVVLLNVNTGTSNKLSTDSRGEVAVTSLVGVYNIQVTGSKTYSFTNNDGTQISRTVKLSGLRENVLFTSGSSSQTVSAYIQIESKGWVIKELFSAGSRTPANSSYYGDQFVEIYNNTDTIMYADGLSIGETRHTTSTENFFGSAVDSKVYIYTAYTIEGDGSGKSIPVQGGTSILIAPQPIDHRVQNANSFDLSMADFQWYDAFGNLGIDVPTVPNMVKYFSASASIWIVTAQMNRGFILYEAPKGKSMAQFINENADTRNNSAGKPVESIGIPNEYVLDAIELGNKITFKSKSLAASLDVGFMYTLSSYNGRSIRRKVERVESDGRVVYKDTNNSTLDFWANKKPSPKKYPTNDEKDDE